MPAPSPGSPATKKFNVKRDAIISSASQLFNERGIAGATLADVATSVGLIKNSVTYYYRRKEELAHACIERSISVWSALIEQASTVPDQRERITTLLQLHARLHADIAAGTHPPVMSFNDIRALPEPQLEQVFAAYTAMFRKLRQLIDGRDTNGLARDALNARTHMLLSLVNSMNVLAPRYEVGDHVRMVGRLSDIVLDGMAAPGSGWIASGPEEQWQLNAQEDTPATQFLHAAIELINEQGYRGASVVKISDRLNLTKGAFYYYNAKKDDLVEQCFEHSFFIMRKAIDLAESVDGNGWSHLAALARGLVRFQLSEAGPLLRSTARSALPDAERKAKIGAVTDRLAQRVSGLLVSGLLDGSVRPLDPTLASHYTLATINAAAELRRWVPAVTERSSSDLYARPMLFGLLSP